MARGVGFEGCNKVYGAPKGQEATVYDLEVYQTADSTITCWRMTTEELAKIAETGVVWLRVQGHGFYPANVSGEPFHAMTDDGGQTWREPKAEPVTLNRRDLSRD